MSRPQAVGRNMTDRISATCTSGPILAESLEVLHGLLHTCFSSDQFASLQEHELPDSRSVKTSAVQMHQCTGIYRKKV